MKLLDIQKKHDGKFIKYYEMKYLNKVGNEKIYEMVAMHDIKSVDDIGKVTSGLSIIAYTDDKILLLKEYRMAVHEEVINLCAGMIEPGESIEESARRELYEETGLEIEEITHVLPPVYAAVGISDVKTQVVFAKVKGTISDHSEEDESIVAGLYTKEEVMKLMETYNFSSKAQMAAFFFINDKLF